MMDYFFYTEQMTVGYDGKPLIKEIEIRLRRGEILTLIGPNGAGKSTILKSITRQLKLLGGAVYLERQSADRADPAGTDDLPGGGCHRAISLHRDSGDFIRRGLGKGRGGNGAGSCDRA